MNIPPPPPPPRMDPAPTPSNPAPPPPPPPPPRPLLTETDAEFFTRLSSEMRAYDPKETLPEELRKRRLFAALTHAYLSYLLFLRARRWPLGADVAGIALDLETRRMDDLERLYARIVTYVEHQGMFVEDKHFLALQRFAEVLSPTPPTLSDSDDADSDDD